MKKIFVFFLLTASLFPALAIEIKQVGISYSNTTDGWFDEDVLKSLERRTDSIGLNFGGYVGSWVGLYGYGSILFPVSGTLRMRPDSFHDDMSSYSSRYGLDVQFGIGFTLLNLKAHKLLFGCGMGATMLTFKMSGESASYNTACVGAIADYNIKLASRLYLNFQMRASAALEALPGAGNFDRDFMHAWSYTPSIGLSFID
jgi:hypothetical protein